MLGLSISLLHTCFAPLEATLNNDLPQLALRRTKYMCLSPYFDRSTTFDRSTYINPSRVPDFGGELLIRALYCPAFVPKIKE